MQLTGALKRVGDAGKTKTLQDVLNFKARLEQNYAASNLDIINARIRFQHIELYMQLRKLSARMSSYQYRFLIIYWVTYLEEYEQACQEYIQQQHTQNF